MMSVETLNSRIGRIVVGILAGGLLALPAAAVATCPQISTVDGLNLPTKYATAANALQDNYTGFGDATPPTNPPSEGNELDRLFVRNDTGAGAKLYIGVTGNTERFDETLENTIIVLLDTGPTAATNVLNTAGITGSNALKNMSGVTLDAAFAPDWALAVWNVAGVQYGILHNLANPSDTGVPLTLGTQYGVDNGNLMGVSAEPAHDPLQQQVNAASATQGVEFAIEMATLGITPSSSVGFQVLLVNGSGYISNQSLPVLNPTSGNQGGGVPCIGRHDPAAVPPNIVDFNNFTGDQFITIALDPNGSAPFAAPNGQNIPGDFGTARATQNNYTCFGDAAPFSPLPSPGSELNQLFIRNDFSKIYFGITGNIPAFEDFNNTILIFIDTGSGMGSQTLFTAALTGGSGALQGMDGITFDPGFAPDRCIEYWRGGNQHNCIVEDIVFDNPHIVPEFTTDTSRHVATAINAYAADLSNILGVNDIAGDDPIRQEERAVTALRGLQVSLRLADLGLTSTSTIKVAACITSGSGFVSNQWLPVLNPTVTPPQTASVSFNDAPLPAAIPDNSPAGVTDTRTVSMPAINRVTDVNVSVSITHPQVNNLTITLRHNGSGRTVVLWNPSSGSGTNLNTTFDSDNTMGTTLPVESLLTFNGVNPNGPWSLIVTDSVAGDSGTLDSWGLEVTEYKGGNVNCLGEHAPTADPPIIIDLSSDSFPANQYVTVALSPTGTPCSSTTNSYFTGQNVPFLYSGQALMAPAQPQNPCTAMLPAVAAWATQNNFTCFGDATETAPTNLPGSEMDQLFVKNVAGDRLRVAITGNLENNGNAFIVLLDTDPNAGVSTITGITPPPTPLGGGGTEPGLNGLTVDPGFSPDYAVVVHRDPSPTVPADDYNVFITHLSTNQSRTLGRLTRGSHSGVLLEPIANQNGSEIDQLFVKNDGGNLYLAVTGNLEANGNGYLIFIESGAGGSNVLNTNFNGFPQILRNVSGDVLDVGMDATHCIVMTRAGGNYLAQLVDLRDTTPPLTITNLNFVSTVGPNNFYGNNNNVQGVNANPSTPPAQQQANAATATLGVQFAIDRAALGSPADNTPIDLCVALVGGSGYWSNQTLPGMGGGVNNLGDNANLNNVPGNQFTAYTFADTSGYFTPGSFNGTNLTDPQVMGGVALAVQDNHTGFGDVALPNPGNPNCTQVAFDDSNILGVTNTSHLNAETAQTGMEFDLAFEDVGLAPLGEGGPLATIRVMAVLTGRFGYLSNQFLPGLHHPQHNVANLGNIPAQGLNLGTDPRAPGEQFLVYQLVVPCTAQAADINNDGAVNLLDVDAFVAVLFGTNTDTCALEKADYNGDQAYNGLDVRGFIVAFLNP